MIRDLIGGEPTLSFEFFPPADTAGRGRLDEAVDALERLRPSFVSVTCGAGGQGHDRTRDIVVDINRRHDFAAMAHLTCVGHTRAEVDRLLADYAAHGVDDVLALAGDPPPDGSTPRGDFTHAIELVDVVRERRDFSIAVAAHPEVHPRSPDRVTDRRHLAAKLARADFAITQFFFDPAHYRRLVDDLDQLGCHKPIIPGIFPVTAPKTVRRFAAMNGTAIPEALFERVESAPEADRRAIAVEAAARLAHALLDEGAPGLHVYTMNRPETATALVEALGLRR